MALEADVSILGFHAVDHTVPSEAVAQEVIYHAVDHTVPSEAVPQEVIFLGNSPTISPLFRVVLFREQVFETRRPCDRPQKRTKPCERVQIRSE